jgi:hypothetical protein
MPPSDRTTKPTPKAANVDSREVTSSHPGKNLIAITVAM